MPDSWGGASNSSTLFYRSPAKKAVEDGREIKGNWFFSEKGIRVPGSFSEKPLVSESWICYNHV